MRAFADRAMSSSPAPCAFSRWRWAAAGCLVALSLVVAACQVSHGRLNAPRLARAVSPLGPLDPQAAAATMARLCGTTYEKPMVVHEVDDAEFLERFHAHDPARRFEGVPLAFWTGFHFAADAHSVGHAARASLDAGISGFYDLKADELFVRKRLPPETGRFVLAHEVAHGVQHRLGLGPLHGVTTDEGLARLALVEGGANLMAAAYLTLEREHAVGVAVARIRDRLAKMSTADVATLAQLPPSILQAPSVVRTLQLFPYIEGTAFATALYQSGGMPLLNAALAHPPTSTEQILHPKKYLQGERPVPVTPPVYGRGTVVAHGTLGELQTAAYLGECLDARRARQTAEGWGGDAYTVILDEQGRVAVLWATAWDTPESAARFESALRAREGCATAGAPRTLRRDEKVAVVDAPPDMPYDLEDLLARVQPALPRAPPLGDIALRVVPAPEPRFLHRGEISGDLFVSKQLGIELRIPAGMEADVPTSGLELTFHKARRSAALGYVFDPVSATEERDLAKKLATSILPATPSFVLEQEGYVIRLPIGLADVEQVRTPEGNLLLAAFVPVCDGEATLVLVSASTFELITDATDAWFDGVRVTDDSPACAYLQALASPGRRSFAEQSAEAASPSADELTQAAPPSAPEPAAIPPFNVKVAKERLSTIATTVASCKEGGRAGKGRVLIVFAPTGVPESVTLVGPPFEATAAGACIVARFQQARVPPFDGPSMPVTKSFSIE